MRFTLTVFVILALIAVGTSVRTHKKASGCSWKTNFEYNGKKYQATVSVPAKGNNLSGSGSKCKSDGLAEGTISINGGLGSVSVIGRFSNDGVAAGAIVGALVDKRGNQVIPSVYVLEALSYSDLIEYYASKAI